MLLIWDLRPPAGVLKFFGIACIPIRVLIWVLVTLKSTEKRGKYGKKGCKRKIPETCEVGKADKYCAVVDCIVAYQMLSLFFPTNRPQFNSGRQCTQFSRPFPGLPCYLRWSYDKTMTNNICKILLEGYIKHFFLLYSYFPSSKQFSSCSKDKRPEVIRSRIRPSQACLRIKRVLLGILLQLLARKQTYFMKEPLDKVNAWPCLCAMTIPC